MIMTDGRTDGEWTDGMQMQMDRNFVEILVMVELHTYLSPLKELRERGKLCFARLKLINRT